MVLVSQKFKGKTTTSKLKILNLEVKTTTSKLEIGNLKEKHYLQIQNSNTIKYTVAVYSWSIANNFVIDVYCRCLHILCQIA